MDRYFSITTPLPLPILRKILPFSLLGLALLALAACSSSDSSSGSSNPSPCSSGATLSNAGSPGTARGELIELSEVDLFQIVLEAGTTYQFDVEGSTGGGGTLADPELSLVALTGERNEDRCSDDDSGDGSNPRFTYTVPAAADGQHFLVLYGWEDSAGTYTLSVRSGGTDSPSPIPVTSPEAVPGSIPCRVAESFPLTGEPGCAFYIGSDEYFAAFFVRSDGVACLAGERVCSSDDNDQDTLHFRGFNAARRGNAWVIDALPSPGSGG